MPYAYLYVRRCCICRHCEEAKPTKQSIRKHLTRPLRHFDPEQSEGEAIHLRTPSLTLYGLPRAFQALAMTIGYGTPHIGAQAARSTPLRLLGRLWPSGSARSSHRLPYPACWPAGAHDRTRAHRKPIS
jgi:hypothetical protein